MEVRRVPNVHAADRATDKPPTPVHPVKPPKPVDPPTPVPTPTPAPTPVPTPVQATPSVNITINVNGGQEGRGCGHHGHAEGHHRPYGAGHAWGRLQQELARAEVIGLLLDLRG